MDGRTLTGIARALGGEVHAGGYVMCPGPGHSRRDRSLKVWIDDSGAVRVQSYAADAWQDCRDYVLRVLGEPDWRDRADPVPWSPPARKADDTDRTVTPREIWRRALAGEHPTTRRYLDARGIRGPAPATIRFLPARGDHAPAMVSAFGLATEPEPGVLEISDDAVQAVHLTRLRPDGSGKADDLPDRPAKIMLGNVSGTPIVLSPINDLLGLAIVEGVESGLSVAAATGLGVWCAGSASLLPALADAVPSWIDCVTVASDPDPAGRKFGAALVERLAGRGLNARLGLLEGVA